MMLPIIRGAYDAMQLGLRSKGERERESDNRLQALGSTRPPYSGPERGMRSRAGEDRISLQGVGEGTALVAMHAKVALRNIHTLRVQEYLAHKKTPTPLGSP